MAENLKVNARTDILEFKRKHNLLVENATIKTTVSNIKQLTNADIENLSCGDVVLKEDESGKHAYLVSFKSDTGLCLTYCDASCVETQSYNKVGTNWQYNSEDKWEMTKPVYCHPISIQGTSGDSVYKIKIALLIFDNNSEPYNTHAKLVAKLQQIFAINASAVFPITGGLYNTSDTRLHIAQKIDKEGEQINIRTLRSDGENGYFALGSFNTPNCDYYDGVNKIN